MDGVTIEYKKNKLIIKFKSKDNGIIIAMESRDLYNLTRNYYENLYDSLPLDEISIKKNQPSETRFPNITSEKELNKFISNHEIIRLVKNMPITNAKVPQKQQGIKLLDLDLEQRIKLLSKSYDNKKEIRSSFYSFCHIQNPFGINDYKNYGIQEADITIRNFTKKEKEIIKKYISKYTNFYSLNIYNQYAFINEIIRKINLSSERYELEKILESFDTDNYDRFGIGLKSSISFPEDEIKNIFSLLTKSVFLSNKEKLFDQNSENVYNGIDTTNLNISYIQKGIKTQKQIFRRLKNSFTHYRYTYSNEDIIDLDTTINLFDEDKKEKTFDATIKLKNAFKLITNINFLRELNENFKLEDDKPIKLISAEELLYYSDILNEHKIAFKDLPKNILNNEDIVLMALLRDINNGENHAEIIKIVKYIDTNNKDLVKKILFYAPDAIQYLEGYQNDQEIADIVLSKCGTLINFFNTSLFTKENILMALENYVQNGTGFVANILINIPDEFFLDDNFTKKAIEYEGLLLGWIKSINPNLYKELKNDIDFAKKVAESGGSLKEFDESIYKSFELNKIRNEKIEQHQRERYNQRKKEKSRNLERYNIIYKKLRNRSDDEKGRYYIQSDIEKVLGLDRRKENDAQKSKKILGILKEKGRYYISKPINSTEEVLDELRKKGEFRTISDIKKAQLLIERDLQGRAFMELGEKE